MNNDALNNIKKLRDVLNEAIAALEAGREVQVEEKRPCDVATWHEVAVFRDRDYRCTIKPREVWINENADGSLRCAAMKTREYAQFSAVKGRNPIRFVEADQCDTTH